MKFTNVDQFLAYHCAPALAGIKPSNIIFVKKSDVPELRSRITELNNLLNSKNIHLEILRECESKIVLMVYRKDVLEKHLCKSELREFLMSYGYPESSCLDNDISHLKETLKEDCFPHEIGVFLGYPLCDIIGYINKQECLHTGDWKVYANVEESKELFKRFKACRKATCKRVDCGCCLAQIFSPSTYNEHTKSA